MIKRILPFLLILFAAPALAQTPLWNGILKPTSGASPCNWLASGVPADCGIDWTPVGVLGGVPTTYTLLSTINSTGGDQTAAINSLLNSCNGTGQYVQLGGTPASPQTFAISGLTITKDKCVLVGGGANATILNATGTNAPVTLGSAGNSPNHNNSLNITSGATAGSTSLLMSAATGLAANKYLVVSELNYNPLVTLSGDPGGGGCNFCWIVGSWTWDEGEIRARGQTVEIETVGGSTCTGSANPNCVIISPGLYTDYLHTLPNWAASVHFSFASVITNGGHYYVQTISTGTTSDCVSGGSTPAFSTSGGSVTDGNCSWKDLGVGTTTQPAAVPFTATHYAGVQNLQIKTNNTGSGQNVSFTSCAYCFETGVADNYTDGDHVDVQWGYRDEIRDNYFSNAYLHTAGAKDSEVNLYQGTSATLVQNNILERLHVAVMVEEGASGNVIAHNFSISNYTTASAQNITSLSAVGTTATLVTSASLSQATVGQAVYINCTGGSSASTWSASSGFTLASVNAGTKTYTFTIAGSPAACTSGTAGIYSGFFDGSFSGHAAHTQFNLWEGNVAMQLYMDSTWGSHSHDTTFRNWMTMASLVCTPYISVRANVVCSPLGTPAQAGNNSYYAFQSVTGFSYNFTVSYFNNIGNIIGSTPALNSLLNTGGTHIGTPVASLTAPSTRNVFNSNSPVYGYNFGFANSSDSGTYFYDGPNAFNTTLIHGDYNFISGTTTWNSTVCPTAPTCTLPPSFYLVAKPAWWGTLPWPAIGPDVSGGTGPGGHTSLTASNPAQRCYLSVMGGADGAAGSPLAFNAADCYGSSAAVAAPTFSPVAGTFNNNQSVALSTVTVGATIFYCTDTVNTCTPSTAYASALPVTSTQYVRAQGTLSGSPSSSVASAQYVLAASSPVPAPAAGSYASAQSVALSSATTSSTLLYCTDTINTCTPSTTYTAPIAMAATGFIRSQATKTGYTSSAVVSSQFIISVTVTPSATISIMGIL